MEALTDWGSACGGGLLEAWILAELAERTFEIDSLTDFIKNCN